MNAKTLRKAIAEAERFLSVARPLRGTIKKERTCLGREYESMESGTHLSGAVRRASLDLTCALAEMRRY